MRWHFGACGSCSLRLHAWQHRNWFWLRFPPPMTIRRGHSCSASNPGNQEPRNPFEELPLQVQRQYSRDLLHHVQRAVFSHLGVDSVDVRHLPQPKNQVELHVHHHHHLYVDRPQNSQQPSSPQIAAINETSIARSPRSKSMWKDYDEMANKTILDILWSKNHPFYSSNITKKDTEPPPKKHREDTTLTQNHPTFETACVPATPVGFSKIEKTGENRGISTKVSPTTVTSKGLNSPFKSTWKEFSPPNKPVSAKRSSSAHVGTERKHSSRAHPTTKSVTKSKIRSLEEAAQERIKRLSDLGSLINSAETGFREDSRPKDTGVSRHERREAAIQTHIDSNIVYGHQSRPKNETFQEESEAAKESFLAAARAAKDRLRNLVNECANANARPYGVEAPQLLAADIRRQKELQALEKIQSCIHEQELDGAQQNITAKSPTWPPPVPAASPYTGMFSARPPSRESNNSEVPSSRPTARSLSPSSDISSRSLSQASIPLSDIPPSVQNARPPSQASNASDVPYAVKLAPALNTWPPLSQAPMPNYANQVKPYAPPDEVVEKLQDASFQENNQAMEEILRNRPRPTKFGRKPKQPPLEDTKQIEAETPTEVFVQDKALPNQEQQQQLIDKLGSDLEVVRISSPLEYMRLFQEQHLRPKTKIDNSGAKEKAQDTWAKVESELAKLVSGLALNNIEDALLNLEKKLTNVESLRYQVVEALKVRDEGHNNIMEGDRDQWKTNVPEGYSLYNSPAYETQAADLDTEDVILSPHQAESVAEKGNDENHAEIELECLKDENKKLRMELQQLQAKNSSQLEMQFATQGKSHMEIEALREMNKKLKLELQQIREDNENEIEGGRAKFAIQEAEFEKLQEVNNRLQSELQRVQGKYMNDKQDLMQKLSGVVMESESLKCSLEVTKREILDEDRKNGLLKQWLGDKDLHRREYVILNSAQELNSELVDNLSRMEDTLADFGTSVKSLLPFLEEHAAITKSLAEVFQKKSPRPEIEETTTSQASEMTDKIEALKKAAEAKRHQINELVDINKELLLFAQRKEDELARLNEEASQLQDETGQQEMPEDSNPQLLLMREIEETKKQSREMVEIMDSLEYHYGILKAKFTQLENEMAQRDKTVERLSSHLAARIEGEEYVLEEAKQLQNSLKNAQYNEYEMKNQAERLAKMKQELEGKLHDLEREISMSHAQIEELKSQNTVIKDLMESKEQEAEAMRQETGDIKWRMIQLEEELMEKEGQIAILKGNFLDDSD